MSPAERLRAWGAVPTGETWRTPSSALACGALRGVPVIAKVALVEEERRGGLLMAWWSAHGGLPVLQQEGDALLMRRATGGRDLVRWSTSGRDDAAVDVLVDAAAALHAMPPAPAAVGAVPLRTWFRALLTHPRRDPLLDRAASVARDLLDEGGQQVVLHGDVHHGNVLDTGDRWAAIDPKALIGAREFDLANLLLGPSSIVASARLDARLERVAERAAVDPQRLAAWALAWCGLSLSWSAEPADDHARAAREVAGRLSARLR